MFAPITTPEFWDCNCEKDYINPKTLLWCPECQTAQGDAPDSMIVEVARLSLSPSGAEPTEGAVR